MNKISKYTYSGFLPIYLPTTKDAGYFSWLSLSYSNLLGLAGIFLVINILIFFITLLVLLRLTKNSKGFSLIKILILSIVTSILSAILTIVVLSTLNPLLQTLAKTSLFSFISSYSFQPVISFVALILIPGIANFIILYFLLKRYKVSRIILISLVVAFLNTSWWAYPTLMGEYSSLSKIANTQISQKEKEEFSNKIKVDILGEEIVKDHKLPKYNQLRFKTSVDVPRDGTYSLDIILTSSDKYKDTPSSSYIERPLVFYVNNIDIRTDESRISLKTGKNEIVIDIPYVENQYSGSERLNITPKDPKTPAGDYGPYVFKANLVGYKDEKGFIGLKVGPEDYITKQYFYTDFYQ